MDDPKPCPECARNFVTIRLVLLPDGPAVELTRPDMVIGRHTTADVRLPLPDVSRRHCRCVFADSFWQIFDLDSLNGIFVNGQRVQRAILRDHDVVGIGSFRFQVQLCGRQPALHDAFQQRKAS
jgi:pSer/pThr/pTyr-binding forkhead associated (FHA) protein